LGIARWKREDRIFTNGLKIDCGLVSIYGSFLFPVMESEWKS
jgi:hypothetical protein